MVFKLEWKTKTAIQTTTATQIIPQSEPTTPGDSTSTSNLKAVNLPPNLPAEYIQDPHDLDPEHEWCETRFGLTYLETLAKNVHPYCTEDSRSQMDCMHSVISDDSRKDSFCIIKNAIWDEGRFNVDCKFRDWSDPDLEDAPNIWEFINYWYNTGPRNVMNQWMNVGDEAVPWFDKNKEYCNSPTAKKDDTYKILIQREGGSNYWHTLMEIFSFYFTIDTLQMATNNRTGKPYLLPSSLPQIQLLVLDDHGKKYFELWNYFSDLPILHIEEWTKENPTACLNNLILPLPGASNPLWHGDWDPRNCDHSLLVDTLRSRILSHLKIPTDRDLSSEINITIIDRKASRKLSNSKKLTDRLIAAYPEVSVNVVDMAALTLTQQISIIVQTDILVGVHGAGHTHGFFLPPQSSVVEILPAGLKHKGFRNVAGLRGLRYFSDHAPMARKGTPEEQAMMDWHVEDLEMDEEAWMRLMDAAIQSVAHRGYLDSDVD
ncbi:hypothetical protein ABW19_dt0203565 [Dactylella cylindrospora]|nr:hypothetical protein ABW19_dt0203565 [Dactylella cylindrospora]